jgi:hypothetical protein
MLTNLKRILLTQYIGAIITAYLTAQGMITLIGVVVYLFGLWLQTRDSSVLGGSNSRFILNWGRVLPEIVRTVLYLAVAGAFVWWLYLERPSEAEADLDEISDEDETAHTDESE